MFNKFIGEYSKAALKIDIKGSGRAVAFDIRDWWFKSSIQHFYLLSTLLKDCFEKTKKRKKWPGMTHQKTKL